MTEDYKYMELDKKKYNKLKKELSKKEFEKLCPVSYMKEKTITIPDFDWRKDDFWAKVNIKTSPHTTTVSIKITKEVRRAIGDALKEYKLSKSDKKRSKVVRRKW